MMTPTGLTPGRAYRQIRELRAVPNSEDAATMQENPPIPSGAVFMAWPYMEDPQMTHKIAESGRVSGRLHDVALDRRMILSAPKKESLPSQIPWLKTMVVAELGGWIS